MLTEIQPKSLIFLFHFRETLQFQMSSDSFLTVFQHLKFRLFLQRTVFHYSMKECEEVFSAGRIIQNLNVGQFDLIVLLPLMWKIYWQYTRRIWVENKGRKAKIQFLAFLSLLLFWHRNLPFILWTLHSGVSFLLSLTCLPRNRPLTSELQLIRCVKNMSTKNWIH